MKNGESLNPMYFNLDMIFKRHEEYHIVPISFGKNIVTFWEAIARELGLELLSNMDILNIIEATQAQQLIKELKHFEVSIKSNSHNVELADDMQKHFLKRIQILILYVDDATNHWEEGYSIITAKSGP